MRVASTTNVIGNNLIANEPDPAIIQAISVPALWAALLDGLKSSLPRRIVHYRLFANNIAELSLVLNSLRARTVILCRFSTAASRSIPAPFLLNT